ncbi:MAG: ATP-dependent DNA helicase [Actinomycetota bacterium]
MSPQDLFATGVSPQVRGALGDRDPTRQQWAAISAPLEPCVLVAGAGSGKTAVMTARIVWLVSEGHARAGEILGLTFTNKAADTLTERVRRALAPLGLPDGEEPAISTYHSFAARMIADYGLRAGVEPGATLLSGAQAWQIASELFLRRTFEALEVRSLYHVKWVLSLADECSNHLVEPEEIVACDTRLLERLSGSKGRMSAKVIDAARRRIELAAVVRDYIEVKRARNLVDFGDQIRLAAQLAADPAVAADFRARYSVALLDEYQDTNVAQAKMLRLLMPDGYPVMAVGDPDQNIYAWRGASLHNLLAFPNQFRIDAASPAASRPLSVNFRSGARILDLANVLIAGIPAARRPPGKVLEPYPPLGEGEVAIFSATDQVSEAERVADEARRAHDAGTPWSEIAILCRKKRLFGSFVEVFREAEIPLEVVDIGGLLMTPEVVDLVALLRVLHDSARNVALARLLRGPRWRIGHRDLAVLARHAAAANGDLRARMEVDSVGDVAFSLAEALDAVDDVEGLSEEGRARISQFVAELAELRAAAHLPLPDLAARALESLGIVAELDASSSPAAPAAKRNLAHFVDRVASFEPVDGEATLETLVEWLDAVAEVDEEFDASQPTDEDSVKLMTIHQAKGLEFDVVFVPGMAAGARSKIFPDTSIQANPATSARNIPFELRGDSEILPHFEGNLTAFQTELVARAEEEERRLLYVAVTRARSRLVCSSAHWYYPVGLGEALKTPMAPSEYWEEIRAFPGVHVMTEVRPPQENPLVARRAARAQDWPPSAGRVRDAMFPDGFAAEVARARTVAPQDSSLFAFVPSGPPGPVLPRSLPVSSLVTYAGCPKRFYWSYVRPLPRRPGVAARIGTLVHSWIERRADGQMPLLDVEQFEERDPTEFGARIAELKTVYERTRFAAMKPLHSEQKIALVFGDVVVQGRIDAIFARPEGGWEIVDFKTGRLPAEGDEAADRQLELYALAAQEIWGKAPEDLTLTFASLTEGERQVRVRPAVEIRADVERALAEIAAAGFDPAPSSACRSCDFLARCPQGRAEYGT